MRSREGPHATPGQSCVEIVEKWQGSFKDKHVRQETTFVVSPTLTKLIWTLTSPSC